VGKATATNSDHRNQIRIDGHEFIEHREL